MKLCVCRKMCLEGGMRHAWTRCSVSMLEPCVFFYFTDTNFCVSRLIIQQNFVSQQQEENALDREHFLSVELDTNIFVSCYQYMAQTSVYWAFFYEHEFLCPLQALCYTESCVHLEANLFFHHL
jgi:hypothetical protein